MNKPQSTEEDFTENDLIFECPFCSKSMAIDKRGMGLTIHCPECDGLVKVPTVSESVEEDTHSISLPVEGLAVALEEHRDELDALKEKLASVEKEREKLEKAKALYEEELTELRREFGNIQAALDQVSILLAESGPSDEGM